MVVFFGMWMMVEDFWQGGTVACVKDRLNILVKTPVNVRCDLLKGSMASRNLRRIWELCPSFY